LPKKGRFGTEAKRQRQRGPGEETRRTGPRVSPECSLRAKIVEAR